MCPSLQVLIIFILKFVLAERVSGDIFIIPSIQGNQVAGTIRHNASVDTSATTTLKIASHTVSEETNLKKLLTKCWNLETIGIETSTEYDGNLVAEQIEINIQFIDGRYIVSLPWKKHHAKLHS